MSGSLALKGGDDAYWSFLDAVVESVPVRKMRLKQSDGAVLLADLRSCPVIDFGTFEVDFASDGWDFSGITELNIPPARLRFQFDRGPMADVVKLYVITSIIWRRAKIQTIKAKFLMVERAVRVLALTPGNVRLLAKAQADGYLDSLRLSVGFATLGGNAAALSDFLVFYERLFGGLVDPDVIPRLDEVKTHCRRVAAALEGFPCVPVDYESALFDTALRVMRDDGEELSYRITAAAIVILFTVGFRSCELLVLEAGAISLLKGEAGMPDIAKLAFKTYKGVAGDGSYALRSTVVGAQALEAYLFLETACEERRRKLGVRTLVVYPRQRAPFCGGSALNRRIRYFTVRFCDSIPCVNSSSRFPELSVMPASEAARASCLAGRLADLGLGSDDEIVYVTPHMLRVTFATRLYEAGYDLAVISKFMNHVSSDMTVGYIHSDREAELLVSEKVYRALLEDGAELMGPRGEEFAGLVREYAASLAGTVYEGGDELIAACSERYPLRLKPGYVCTKCGTVLPCRSDSGTDEVFCAFGVCKNQHHMYFMLDVHLDAARFHMRLVEENRAHGHVMAAKNELRKARNVIEGTILPELASLDEQVGRHGEGHVLDRHPQLREIVCNRKAISEEVESWLKAKM